MAKMIGFFLGGALLVSALTVHAADAFTARDEADVLHVEAQWAKAAQTGDTAAMDRLLAPDYAGVSPGGNAMNKAQELDLYRRGDLKFDSVQMGDQKVKVYIGGVIVTGVSTVKGKFKGQDISGQYRFVDILERKPAGWQVVYSQLTKVETEQDKKKPEPEDKEEKPAAPEN